MYTKDEWRSYYDEKEALLLSKGYEVISPLDFYRSLFPEGSLQSDNNFDEKGNAIAVKLFADGGYKRFIIRDNLKGLDSALGTDTAIIPPLSFFGKSYSEKFAHELFAITVDIDYVKPQHLKNLLSYFTNKQDGSQSWRLMPTYLVNSGRGVHLYYLLDTPLRMYRYRVKLLSKLKQELINCMWNMDTSDKADSPDHAGILQGMRAVGCYSKLVYDENDNIAYPGYRTKAHILSGKKYSLEEIQRCIPISNIDLNDIYNKPIYEKGQLTLEEAKRLYPEWYNERIVLKRPPKGKIWNCRRNVYDWWKKKIYSEVRSGGRYFSVVALCAYGIKCGIDKEEIKKDAYGMLEFLDSLTDDEANHFKKSDIDAALKWLSGRRENFARTLSRDWISRNTKVNIPPSKIRRNHQSQADHLEEARMLRDLRMKRQGKKWTDGNGRPKGTTKQNIIQEWRKAYPEGTKAECIKSTGLSKPTVYKWWSDKLA